MTGIVATLDHWHGVFDKPTEFADVDFARITDLIGRLDAANHTLLSLSAHDGRAMMIGGGQGKYVVVRIDAEGQSATLTVDGSSAGSPIVLCVGGQEGDYPSHQVCTIADALSAAEGFLAERYSPTLTWTAG